MSDMTEMIRMFRDSLINRHDDDRNGQELFN